MVVARVAATAVAMAVATVATADAGHPAAADHLHLVVAPETTLLAKMIVETGTAIMTATVVGTAIALAALTCGKAPGGYTAGFFQIFSNGPQGSAIVIPKTIVTIGTAGKMVRMATTARAS